MRRNVYINLSAQWAAAASSIVSSVLVARMMQPEELGVFTVVMSVNAILLTVQMAGANEYLLYKGDTSRETRRKVYGLTVLTTLLICILLVAGRPVWISIYGDPGVADVATVMAVQACIGMLCTPIYGMLVREEEFSKVGINHTVSNLALAACQVGFVWAGFSYMGLAYATVVGGIVSLFLLVVLARHHLILVPRFKGLGEIAAYGGKLAGSNMLTIIYVQMPTMIIGALSGLAQSALYGRANMIAQIYNQTIARAIDPVMRARIASVKREGGDPNEIYLQMSHTLVTVSMLFFGFIAITADLIVPLIFGPQWAPASLAMRILTIGLVLTPLTGPTSAIVLAADRPGLLLRIRTLNVLLRLVILVITAPYGLAAIATGIASTAYFNWAQSIGAVRTVADLKLADYFRNLAPGVVVAIVPLIMLAGTRMLFTVFGVDGWYMLVSLTMAMAVFAFGALWVFKHALFDEVRIFASKITRILHGSMARLIGRER